MTNTPTTSAAPARFRFSLAQLLWAMAGASVLFAAIYWVGNFARASANQATCSNNLKQLAIALQNYHDTFGSFPPAYIADEQGRPMHSWRILIMPFLESSILYSEYRFDEPWNGPNNRLLHARMRRTFHCPSDTTQGAPMTNYVVVVGPETAFPGNGCVSLDQIADGPANTLLVVEVHNSGIHWLEPRDLSFAQMARKINSPAGQGISSAHSGSAQAAFADGHIQILPNTLPAAEVRGLLTIAGGKTVNQPE